MGAAAAVLGAAAVVKGDEAGIMDTVTDAVGAARADAGGVYCT